MKSPQDSSGEETKNDSRGILQEILANSDRKNDSTEQDFQSEIREELVSSATKPVSQTPTPKKRTMRPLYSVILNEIASLSLRKAYSEMLLPDDFEESSPEDKNIQRAIEE